MNATVKKEEKIQKILELSAEERIKIIRKGIWVQYPLANELIYLLEELLEQPKRPRMEGRTIIGPTGNGKTSILQEFKDLQRKKSNRSEEDFHEIIYVESPKTPSVKSLYIEILSECGTPEAAKSGNTEQLKLKVIRLFEDLKIKMLIIDEIHDLLTAKSDRILTQCLNALKGLSNRLQIPIILIGTEKAEEVIKRDSQVLSRYPIIHLYKWEKDIPFLLLLQAFEDSLPLRKDSSLIQPEIAELIYDISGGILGEVAKIVRESAIESIKSGIEKITKNIIKKLHKGRFPKF